MSGKRKKAEPYSEKGLKSRWRKHQKAHPFGLFTPVIEGPDATEQINAKLQRIADEIEPDLSPEAIQRLWKMLKMCEGFQTRRKQGQRVQTKEQPDTLHSDRVAMAKVAQYLLKHKVAEYRAADFIGIHPKAFQRMKASQPDKWAALLADKKYRQAILNAGTSDPNKEQQEQAERWCDEHPAQLKEP